MNGLSTPVSGSTVRDTGSRPSPDLARVRGGQVRQLPDEVPRKSGPGLEGHLVRDHERREGRHRREDWSRKVFADLGPLQDRGGRRRHHHDRRRKHRTPGECMLDF